MDSALVTATQIISIGIIATAAIFLLCVGIGKLLDK